MLDWPINYAARRGFDAESLLGRLIEKMGHIKGSIQDVWLFLKESIFQEKQQPEKIAKAPKEVEWSTLNKENHLPTLKSYPEVLDKTKTTLSPKIDNSLYSFNKPEYQQEWKKLASIQDETVKLLLDYHKVLSTLKNPEEIKEHNPYFQGLIKEVTHNKFLLQEVQDKAPLLTKTFQSMTQQAQEKTKQQSLERDDL